MKARLETNANITNTALLQGIIASLTGNTDLATYPTGFNNLASSISVAICPAGWVVHDATASANSQVIKAPYSDDATRFKYFEIQVTASAINVWAYEDWNATTHTGTNKTGNTATSTQYQRLTLTSAGRIYAFASSKFFVIGSEFGSTFGDGNAGVILAGEFARIPSWNTPATYPAAAVCFLGDLMASLKSVYMPRSRKKSGIDVTGIDATAYLASVGVSYSQWTAATSLPTGSDSKVLNPDSTKTSPFFPLFIVDAATYSIPLGHFSNADLYIAPANLLANLETVLKTGTSQEYIAIQCSGNGHKLLVPNG